MKRYGIAGAVILLLCIVIGTGICVGASREMILQVSGRKTDRVYCEREVHPGDQLSFGWEHSFEHVTWNEYYTVREDGSCELNTIAVGGFGAGIPAEMDCTYRYADGLIYMENIQGSVFPEFNWIHSTTQMKWIAVNGETLITGPEMEQRDRIHLVIRKG